jgi:hypothetical protein
VFPVTSRKKNHWFDVAYSDMLILGIYYALWDIIVKSIIQKATEMLNACQKMPEKL